MACDYISSCSPKFAAAWMNLGIVQAAQNKTQVHRLHRYSVHTCTHVYACVHVDGMSRPSGVVCVHRKLRLVT